MYPPIPEPTAFNNTANDIGRQRKFRIKFWSYFFYACVSSCVLFAPILFVILLPVGRVFGGVLAVSILSIVVMSFLMCLIYYWFIPVVVTPRTLRGYSVWGNTVNLPWEEITRVRPFRILWLLYWRLDNPGKTSVLWLPRFLQDEAGFAQAVRGFVGENHELARRLDL
ncbi:MAG TPA: hypothetical protein VF681_05125 [Abditibacteriaceae bacterium]|jgi:hypothetical protein